eukprot:7071461-Prymnesium_polylepis.1
MDARKHRRARHKRLTTQSRMGTLDAVACVAPHLLALADSACGAADDAAPLALEGHVRLGRVVQRPVERHDRPAEPR